MSLCELFCACMCNGLQGNPTACRTQEQAVKIDEELMGPLGFSVDQLMELAGAASLNCLSWLRG